MKGNIMSRYKRRRKRNSGRKFLFLFILLLLSGAALFWIANKPAENLLPDIIISPTPHATSDNVQDEVVITVTPSESPDVADIPNDDASDNYDLILVNKQNPIPDNYSVGLVELSNGQSVSSRIYPALQEMFDAARANGIYPIIASGYRTAATQQELMDEKIAAFKAEGYDDSEAISKAKEWVAIPGTSEHQLGLAVDINGDGVSSNSDAVYTWLADNAHTFGFICRYPADKVDITGISYEPWHYRYVGVDVATEIYQQGLCLEEYLKTSEQ